MSDKLNKKGIVILPVLAALVMIGMVIVANYQLLIAQMNFASNTEIEMEATQSMRNVRSSLELAIPDMVGFIGNTTNSVPSTTLAGYVQSNSIVFAPSQNISIYSQVRNVNPAWSYTPFQFQTNFVLPAAYRDDAIALAFDGAIFPITATNNLPFQLEYRLDTTANNSVWYDTADVVLYEIAGGAVPFISFGSVNTTAIGTGLVGVPIVVATPAPSPSPAPATSALIMGDLIGTWGSSLVNMLNLGSVNHVVIAGAKPQIPSSTSGLSPSYSIPNRTFAGEAQRLSTNSFSLGSGARNLVGTSPAFQFVKQAVWSRAPSGNKLLYINGPYTNVNPSMPAGIGGTTNNFVTNVTYAGISNANNMYVNLGRVYSSTNTFWHVDAPGEHVTIEVPEALTTNTKNFQPMVIAVNSGRLTIRLAGQNLQARPVSILANASDVRLLNGWVEGSTNSIQTANPGTLWGRLVLLPGPGLSTVINDLGAFNNTGNNWIGRTFTIRGGLAVAGDALEFPIAARNTTNNGAPQSIIIVPDTTFDLKNASERIIYGKIR